MSFPRLCCGTNGVKTMDKKKQTQKVLEYMETHGSIDAWRAMNELRIMRLASRIADLKAEGVPIVKNMRHKKNPDGSYTCWAEYTLAS